MIWQRGTTTERLRELLTVLPDGQFQLLGECVDDRRADAVQAASGLISSLGKLAARMWNRQNHRCRREVVALVEHGIKRHATALVAHRYPALAINAHPDIFSETCHRLIDRVIQRLPDQMHQARSRRRTDVHSRTMADRSNSFQNLNISRRIGCASLLFYLR